MVVMQVLFWVTVMAIGVKSLLLSKVFHSLKHQVLKVDVPTDADPISFFNLIFTKNYVEDLVKNTNEYADKLINAFWPLQKRST